MSDEQWAPAEPTPLAEAITIRQPGAPAAGVQVAGYTDLVEVAQGGDSIVYRAHQRNVGRDVAIKVLSVGDAATTARFRRELEITVRLGRQHPHIVNVLDTTTTSTGEPCLVMDFHDLGSLHDRLRTHGPLPVSEVVEAGTAVADALTFAHRAGVLHRDVKPQNILLLPTSYVLSDFGIARMVDSGHTATMDRFSYRHASPQVLDGLEPTEADDVWSLGSTLFTLLDGRAPFAADDPADDTALAYLRRVRTSTRRPLARTDLPSGLRELIEGCLHPRPEDRVSSAARALAALRALPTEGRSWDPGGGDDDGASGGVSGAPAVAAPPVAAPAGAGPPRGEPTGAEPPDAEPPGAGLSMAEPAAGQATHERSNLTASPEAGNAASASPTSSGAASAGSRAGAARTSAAVSASAPPAPAGLAPAASTPAAVAPSALAHVTDRGSDVSTDAEATGMMPDEDGPADADHPSPGTAQQTDEESSQPRPWRRIVAFLAGVLLAGTAVGVGYQFIRQATAPEPPPPPPPSEMTVPTDPGPVPQEEGPDQAPVGDQQFSPQGLVLVDRGTSAELSWEPPAQDVDYYLVVLAAEDSENTEVVHMVAQDVTEYVVQGLDPDEPQECYAVVGYADDEGQVHTGSSALECR